MGAVTVPIALAITTTAVALPALSEDLDLTAPEAAWLLAGLLLSQATFVAVFGRLGDVRGIRDAMLLGAALIAGGSALTALGGSFPLLLGGRVLQGAGGGALQVSAYAIIAARFDGSDRVKAVGTMGATLGTISGAGALIGGVLSDAVSWRVAVSIPALSLLAVVPAIRLSPRVAAEPGGRVDLFGAALVALISSAGVLLLEAPSLDLPVGLLLSAAIAGGVAVAALPRHVALRPNGFIPAVVIRSPRFVYGALAGLGLSGGYVAIIFAAPLLILADHDWSLTQVGLALSPAAIIGATSARLVSRLVARHDPFRLTALLATMAIVGLTIAALGGGAPAWTVLSFALVLVGFACGQVVLLDRVPLTVDSEVRSVATGLFTLALLVGGAVGSAAIAGLSDPLGVQGALAAVAVLPAMGAVCAIRAGADRTSSVHESATSHPRRLPGRVFGTRCIEGRQE